MTDFNRTAATYSQPIDRVGVAPHVLMSMTGPTFSSLDMVAGILAAVMMLGPLAMAAFSVGRY